MLWVRDLVTDAGIPSLLRYRVTAKSIPEIVTRALESSSMKANPLALTNDEFGEAVASASR